MKCLLCYKQLSPSENDYHQKCIKNIFGLDQIPLFDVNENKLKEIAKGMIKANNTITGVQPKLSLWLENGVKEIRFTVIDHKSNYIIKPQSETFEALPENEDLCMHLSSVFGIDTAKHGLVRLKSGDLAYITKRFDRNGEDKIASEDLCQLSETLTEHKYKGSYEKIGKTIKLYSTQKGLDILSYFKLVVFSFITGNSDMHLKNFSMFEKRESQFSLSPAYDLVSTALVLKYDKEQMALTVNGRKNKITKNDFEALAHSLDLTAKQSQNVYQSFQRKIKTAYWWIDNSFLSDNHKEQLTEMMTKRINLLNK